MPILFIQVPALSIYIHRYNFFFVYSSRYADESTWLFLINFQNTNTQNRVVNYLRDPKTSNLHFDGIDIFVPCDSILFLKNRRLMKFKIGNIQKHCDTFYKIGLGSWLYGGRVMDDYERLHIRCGIDVFVKDKYICYIPNFLFGACRFMV